MLTGALPALEASGSRELLRGNISMNQKRRTLIALIRSKGKMIAREFQGSNSDVGEKRDQIALFSHGAVPVVNHVTTNPTSCEDTNEYFNGNVMTLKNPSDTRNRKPSVTLLEGPHIVPREREKRRERTHGNRALLKYKQRRCVSRARILDYPGFRVLLFARERGAEDRDGNLQGTQKFHMRKRPETGFSADWDPALNYACGRGRFRDGGGRFIGTRCDA